MDRLQKLNIPVDTLMEKKYRTELRHVTKYVKFHKFFPFTSLVTLNLVKDPKVKAAAKDYLYQLLQHKEQFGYLYYLNVQRMLMPLDIQFNGELVLEMCDYGEIAKEIDTIAREIACNTSHLFFEITRVEILYFLTMLVNVNFNWITTDYLLKCNKCHDYMVLTRCILLSRNIF